MGMLRKRVEGLLTLLGIVLVAFAMTPAVATAADAMAPWTSTSKNGKVIINDLEADDVVAVYKVADVTVNTATNNMAVTALGNNADALARYQEHQDAETAALFSAEGLTAVDSGTANANGTFTGRAKLTAGIYLVDVTGHTGSVRTYQNIIVTFMPQSAKNGAAWQWQPVQTVTAKFTETVRLDKKVNGQDRIVASGGEVVQFTVDFSVAPDATEYVMTDESTKNLSLWDNVKLYKGDVEVDKSLYSVTYIDGGVYKGGNDFKFTLTPAFFADKNADGTLVNAGAYRLEYSATVERGARYGELTNTVTHGDETDVATVETYAAAVKAVEQGTDTGLAEAKFELYQKENGEWVKNSDFWRNQPFKTDKNGLAQLNSLPLGDYKIVAVKAPAGYVLPANEQDRTWEFTISPEQDAADGTADYLVNVTASFTKDTLPALPTTGGSGTVLFSAIGALVVIAGAAYALKRRADD